MALSKVNWIFSRQSSVDKSTGQTNIDNLSPRLPSQVTLGCGKLTMKVDHFVQQDLLTLTPSSCCCSSSVWEFINHKETNTQKKQACKVLMTIGAILPGATWQVSTPFPIVWALWNSLTTQSKLWWSPASDSQLLGSKAQIIIASYSSVSLNLWCVSEQEPGEEVHDWQDPTRCIWLCALELRPGMNTSKHLSPTDCSVPTSWELLSAEMRWGTIRTSQDEHLGVAVSSCFLWVSSYSCHHKAIKTHRGLLVSHTWC